MDPGLVEQIKRREEVLGQVRRLLIEKVGVARAPDEIDPDTPLFGSGLGLDSIDAVDLLIYMGSDFNVQLPDDVIGREAMRTVNSLVDLVLAEEAPAHGGA